MAKTRNETAGRKTLNRHMKNSSAVSHAIMYPMDAEDVAEMRQGKKPSAAEERAEGK